MECNTNFVFICFGAEARFLRHLAICSPCQVASSQILPPLHIKLILITLGLSHHKDKVIRIINLRERKREEEKEREREDKRGSKSREGRSETSVVSLLHITPPFFHFSVAQ